MPASVRDTVRGKVSMTPVIAVSAASDSDLTNLIHHDIDKSLRGKLEYGLSGSDKWYYNSEKDMTDSATYLIGTESFTDGSGPIHLTDDLIKYVYIRNTGTTDGSTATTADLYITLNGRDPAINAETIVVSASESIILKFKNATGVQTGMLYATTTTGTVRNIVAAVINDKG